ncbi:MAG: IreB family regulatory phosphoprotein [Firmicutes bacterium]|nr:IreB family regulatory phosphoprotein [Bacillota bacterium]
MADGPDLDRTQSTARFQFRVDEVTEARQILERVFAALKEKGYNPISQIVGYLLSGDPAYITSHHNARSLIRRIERDEILEELVGFYLEKSVTRPEGEPPGAGG